MSMKQSLDAALKKALIDKDDIRKQTIRMVNSNIKNTEIDKGKELSDNDIMPILQKEIKIRHESLKEAENAGRTDLMEKNQAEIKILQEFLPEQMSEEEIIKHVQKVIEEIQPSGMSDMGKVMKELLPRLEGRAPGNQVSKIVSQLLNK